MKVRKRRLKCQLIKIIFDKKVSFFVKQQILTSVELTFKAQKL